MCDLDEFDFVRNGEHVVETKGTVQHNELDNAFVKQQEVWGNKVI